jgi:hypothetical protein
MLKVKPPKTYVLRLYPRRQPLKGLALREASGAGVGRYGVSGKTYIMYAYGQKSRILWERSPNSMGQQQYL